MKKPIIAIFLVSLILSMAGPIPAFAASTPSFGTAATYGILASTFTRNIGLTVITGDAGYTTLSGGGTDTVSGATVTPKPSQAGTDQGTALGILNAEPCDFNFGSATDLSLQSQPLAPGVYCITADASIGTGGITLNGAGTYIFRISGAFTTADNSHVTLNGASACDVFWTPAAAATLGANTTFAGTVIDNLGITVGSTTAWTGRALDFATTITTDTDTIAVPSCASPATLHVVKLVVNSHGGTAVASSFSLHVKLAGSDVAGSPQPGTSAGSVYSLAAGTYTISENSNPSYSQSFSGSCNSSGSISLLAGDNKTCTITNTDVPPLPPGLSENNTLTVIKQIINDNGGTATSFPLFVNGNPVISGQSLSLPAGLYTVTETSLPNYTATFAGDCNASGQVNHGGINTHNDICTIVNSDIALAAVPIPPLIHITKIPSPLVLPNGPGVVTYNYAVSNVGIVPMTGVTVADNMCGPVTYVSGDTNGNSMLDLSEVWDYSCTMTLEQTTNNTVTATGRANGLTASDIAEATVVVGSPLPPPLIDLVKIPTPLFLPAAGGLVKYTYLVTNPGTVPLNDVALIDDKCAQISAPSGDANGNGLLDPGETWTYSCQMTLDATTTNTGTVTGNANGFTVTHSSVVTVVVAGAVPRLPNTGLPPEGGSIPWNIAILSGAIAVLLPLYFVIRKKLRV